eukprot:6211738-Pleurochrysis_carterae.AAC.1
MLGCTTHTTTVLCSVRRYLRNGGLIASVLTYADEGPDGVKEHIAAFLLLKKGNALKAPSGFLLGHMPTASENGWKVYYRFLKQPVDGCDTKCERYTSSVLPFDVAVGDSMIFGANTQFLPAATGLPPPTQLSATLPCIGHIHAFLLGAVWNSTRRKLEHRRWIMTTLYDPERVRKQEVYVFAFEGI